MMPKSCISMGNTKVFTMSRFFKTFLARQGEPAILALIENWERSVGFKAEVTTPLEQRWTMMMHGQDEPYMAVA